VLWTLVYGLWTVLAPPAARAHTEQAAVSVKNYSPITVDGSLEDWVRRLEEADWAGRLQVKRGDVLDRLRAAPIPVNALTARVVSGTVEHPGDFSARVYTLWDAERLYVAAVVTDDDVVTQHAQRDIWQDDGLELWLDCRHDAVTRALQQDDEYHLGLSPASRLRERAVAWAWHHTQAEAVIEAMEVASAATPTGYLLEASVGWAALRGCAPALGGVIGFNLSMADRDGAAPRGLLLWTGRRPADPTQFGHLYFVDSPIDLFISDLDP
jgi:hypothetical protein